MNSMLTGALANLQKQFGTADFTKWNWTRWQYYDRCGYASAGTTAIQFFANALGSVDPVTNLNKTLEETNCPQPTSFGPTFFFIFDIMLDLRLATKKRQPAAIVADTAWTTQTATGLWDVVQAIKNQGIMTIKIADKAYPTIPMPVRQCPGGFGVHLTGNWTHNGAATTDASWWQGPIHTRERYRLAPPQLIEPNQNVQFKWDFTPGTSPALPTLDGVKPLVYATLILDGMRGVPQQ